MRVGRSSLPYLAFAAYPALSLLMVNDPRRPLLPPPLSGKVQLGDLVFVAGIATWFVAGVPGLARVARLAGIPAGAWMAANALSAAVAVWPGQAWRETAGLVASLGFATGQSEPFTIAAEMGRVGLAAWAAFWVLCLRPMWTAPGQAFPGQLARYQALGCGAVLLISVHLMWFRFLRISLAVGLAATTCARKEGTVA